jgi:hypothetical protein
MVLSMAMEEAAESMLWMNGLVSFGERSSSSSNNSWESVSEAASFGISGFEDSGFEISFPLSEPFL